MAKSKVTFIQTESDPQTGCADWEIRIVGDGGYEVVGQIQKETVWCGDGYCADSYSVTVERESWEESKDECFQVANIWSRGRGLTARKALAACKAFAREALANDL